MGRRGFIPGGLSVPPQPPELANLQHWLDMTDPTQVFRDAAGTIQAVNGDKVESIRNKGTSSGHPILDFTANTITLATLVINGLQVISGGPGSANFISSSNDTEVGGASGLTIAMVARMTGLGGTAFADWEWGANLSLTGFAPGNNWTANPIGLSEINSTKVIVLNEWVYIYGSFAAGDNNVRAAGASEVNEAGAYTQRTGNEDLSILLDSVDMAESLIYDIAFDGTQRAALVAYFDSKYGTLPFIT